MRKSLIVILSLILSICLVNNSCSKIFPDAPAEDQVLDGPIEGLTFEQNRQFLRGDVAFNNEVFSAVKGLGPRFVATSCGSCHAGDGKGHPSTTLTRFGQSDTFRNVFLHLGGPQLQGNALPGFEPEKIPSGATFSKFTPPANTGLGLLEAVSDASILSLADENDANGDGISGKPNWIRIPGYCIVREGAVEKDNRYIGRFGKKAGVYDLHQQTANAYNQDMGITSSYEVYDTYSGLEVEPEVTNQTVLDVVFYLKTLKAPAQRHPETKEVVEGKQIFLKISCGNCHSPALRTGPSSIPALANKTISPYSDLLLHDMGSSLNDGYTEGSAMPSEWRTPPLWGLGLSKNSQGGKVFLLHDGRARSIEEAILQHDGEAAQSRKQYTSLSQPDKKLLITFLESL